jgi:thiol-disulfide isomerase/thioredoxin
MRRAGGLILIAGLCLASAAAPAPEGKVPVEPIGYDSLGKLVRSLHGKVVLVNFWASNCIPCKGAFPGLSRLQRKHGKEGFVIVAVTLDDPQEKEARGEVDRFLAQQRPSFNNYILQASADEWSQKLGIIATPCLYLFNRDNQVVRKYTREPDAEELEAEVVKLLAE